MPLICEKGIKYQQIVILQHLQKQNQLRYCRMKEYTHIQIYENLSHKYDHQFNFFFMKAINELIYAVPNSPLYLDFRDAMVDSEDHENMRRMYRRRTILGKEEIKQRLALQSQWYENVLVLKFEYPMMVITHNRTIFQRRMRRMRINKAVDISSESDTSSLQLSEIEPMEEDQNYQAYPFYHQLKQQLIKSGEYLDLDMIRNPSAFQNLQHMGKNDKYLQNHLKMKKNYRRHKQRNNPNSFVNKYIHRKNNTVLKQQKQKELLKYLQGDWFTQSQYEKYEKQQRHKFIVSLWGQSSIRNSQNISKIKQSQKSNHISNQISNTLKNSTQLILSIHDDSFWSDDIFDVYQREEQKKQDKILDWKQLKTSKGYGNMSEIKQVQSMIRLTNNDGEDVSTEKMKAYRDIGQNQKDFQEQNYIGLQNSIEIQLLKQKQKQKQKVQEYVPQSLHQYFYRQTKQNSNNIFGRLAHHRIEQNQQNNLYQSSMSHLICDFDDFDEQKIERQYFQMKKKKEKRAKNQKQISKSQHNKNHQIGANERKNKVGRKDISIQEQVSVIERCSDSIKQQTEEIKGKKLLLTTLQTVNHRKDLQKNKEEDKIRSSQTLRMWKKLGIQGEQSEQLKAIRDKFPRMYQNLKQKNKEQLLQVFSFTAAHQTPFKKDSQANIVAGSSNQGINGSNSLIIKDKGMKVSNHQQQRQVQNMYGISSNNNSEKRMQKKEQIRRKAAALLQKKSFKSSDNTNSQQQNITKMQEGVTGQRNTTF